MKKELNTRNISHERALLAYLTIQALSSFLGRKVNRDPFVLYTPYPWRWIDTRKTEKKGDSLAVGSSRRSLDICVDKFLLGPKIIMRAHILPDPS